MHGTVVLLLIGVFAGTPMLTHAGVFSFVSNLLNLSVDAQALPANIYNSQTLPVLQAAPNVDPNPSKGGGDITIIGGMALLSETGPSGTAANIDDRRPSDEISIYVVREGDSLSQIAEMFNVSASTIMWANNLKKGSAIQPGQTLVILPVSGVRHIVAKGDTIGSIAKKYKGSVEEIVQYNGVSESTALSIGTVIIVPDGEVATAVATTYSSGSSSSVRGTSGPTYSGYYLRPISGGVRTQGIHGYNAVDLAAPVGTPVVASAAGQVIIARDYGWNGGYGNYIVISHENGTQTLYSHTSQNIVYAGQYVVQGQVIGYVGSTGKSTGPHLHFEIRGASNPF
jgi:murein DD-endopeptidase MepM/ murein hydrolase activator NlpD